MKLVFDTNVLLSAILVPGTCRELLRGRALAHDWHTSEALLAEFADKLTSKLDVDPERTPLYLVYRRRVLMVTPAALAKPICRDPDDDLVLATALAAHADAIITGDKDLLILRKHGGVRIRTPRQFLDSPGA